MGGRECLHHWYGAAATVLTEMANADNNWWWGGALVKKVVFVTEVLPILWTGMQPFNRGERFPSAGVAFHRPSFLSFFARLLFVACPRFYRKISRQDRLRATSPDSVDP